MKPRAKTIHQLDAKVAAIVDVMHAAGLLQRPTVKALSQLIGVNYRTLQSAIGNGRISLEMEAVLCEHAGFASDSPEWIDLKVPEDERGNLDSGYSGCDTVRNLRSLLAEVWGPRRLVFCVVSETPTAIDRELACHEITDCGQVADANADIQLFLQSDFGTLYAPSGFKYGFSRARLDMSIIGANGARASVRLGRGTPAYIRNAKLIARGTDKQPSWTLGCDSNVANDILLGEYSTTDTPLLMLTGYGEGTRVETSLSVSIHEAVLRVDGEDGPSNNKLAIVQLLCSLEFAKGRDEAGRVQLCTHAISITGRR